MTLDFSTGVFGDQGRGVVSALGLEAHPALLAEMHSFGKALGVHGAVVVGSATLKEFLVNYARPLIYSTSLPLHRCVCVCVRCHCVSVTYDRGRLYICHIHIPVPSSKRASNGVCFVCHRCVHASTSK